MVSDYTASHTFTDIIKKTSDLTGQMDMITISTPILIPFLSFISKNSCTKIFEPQNLR